MRTQEPAVTFFVIWDEADQHLVLHFPQTTGSHGFDPALRYKCLQRKNRAVYVITFLMALSLSHLRVMGPLVGALLKVNLFHFEQNQKKMETIKNENSTGLSDLRHSLNGPMHQPWYLGR